MTGTLTPVPEIAAEEVMFKDADGDSISFSLATSGDGLLYKLNGSDRGVFKHVKYNPGMGVPGVAMPDINKGFPIPKDDAARILGGLKHLAKKAGAMCDIADEVVIPDGNAPGLPKEVADSLFNMRSSSG